jgi:flagellar hook-basal body complex protein FliE
MSKEIMPLGGVGAGSGIAGAATSIAKTAATGGASFSDIVTKMVDGVEQSQGEANSAVLNMVDGSGEVHDAMIAMQRAEMQLQLTVQVRNKFVQAYQDVMRMPI